MKVLAVNSSLRTGGESKSELLLTHLVEGMREAGAEVTVVNLREKTVKYCLGCFTCSTKTPGRCVHQDDMARELYPLWAESEIAVLATPLFYYTVNAPLKAFIDRTWLDCEPYLVPGRDGRWTHPARHQIPSIVMLSVAGFPHESVFAALSNYANSLWGPSGRLLAEIYRPAAEALTQAYPDTRRDVLDATRQAGRELVTTRRVAPETLARIRQPLGDPQEIALAANAFWKTCIAEGVTPRELARRRTMVRPETIEELIALLSMAFDPDAAADANAVFQFEFSGTAPGACYLAVERGTMRSQIGRAERADLTIRAPFELWVAVLAGQADLGQLLMLGRLGVEGDLSLLARMGRWFSGRQAAREEERAAAGVAG